MLVLGRDHAFDDLVVEPPREDEDWPPEDPARFERYAHRLWDGLLAVEEVTDR